MPKLWQMLDTTERTDLSRVGVDSARMTRFAYLLRISVTYAERLARKRDGHIFSRGGFCVPDTDRSRKQIVRVYGYCVVFPVDGDPYVIDKSTYKRAPKRDAQRDALSAYIRKRAEQRKREKLFRDGQGTAHPKHGGHANSHTDIGFYVGNYAPRLCDLETQPIHALGNTIRINNTRK